MDLKAKSIPTGIKNVTSTVSSMDDQVETHSYGSK